MRRAVHAVTLAGFVGLVVAGMPRQASAQTVRSQIPMSPTGKGIVGCGLLGAETVALIEGAAGVRARWAYAVFPLLGAAGGAVGGYFLEQAATSGSTPDSGLTAVSVATLVAGIGLLIPTLIVYVNATSFHPETEVTTDDNAPANAPLEESTPGLGNPPASSPSGPSGGAVTQPGVGAPAHSSIRGAAGPSLALSPRPFVPPAILNLGTEGMSLGVPAVTVGTNYSLAEVRQYGVVPQAEVRVPVFSGTF